MNLESPFAVLGTPDDADDADIRAAYIAAVQRHPPDRDPDGFQRVRAAYDVLKSKDERLKLRLFGRAAQATGTPSEWLAQTPPQRLFVGPLAWLNAIRKLSAETEGQNQA